MPSDLPHWPGREEMAARTRPVMNWSVRSCSTLASFCLSVYFLAAFLDLFLLRLASSASVSLAPFLRPRGRAKWDSYHCLKGAASMTTMALFTTSMILVLREMPSEPQEKLPWSRRRARYFLLPPRTRRVWILCGASLVMAAGLANSNFLFFLMGTRLPP